MTAAVGAFSFELPVLSPDARPDFTDARSCNDWLRALPLINVAPSHGRLLGEMEELNCFDMPAPERLKVLELMREPVLFMQTEHAKKIVNRAVPLARPEREILINIDAMWAAMGHGYARCLLAFSEGERGPAALACQRALWCTARKMAEQYKCYRQPATDDWVLLHRLFALAEQSGFADEQVEHPEHGSRWKTTCMETYVGAVLLDLANPNELSARQMGLITRWLERFGGKARMRSGESAADTGAAHSQGGGLVRPIVLDLAGERGASRLEQPARPGTTATLRVVDVTDLARSMRKRIGGLQRGDAPASLGLGEDVPAQLAENLLGSLYRLWCEDRVTRAPGRRSVAAVAETATGMGAIHFYVSGRPFKQPGEAKELSKAQREEIATFGRVATRQDDEYVKLQGFSLESWAVQDESVTGYHLRRATGAGRFLHLQLVALRPSDSRYFTLGVVRWLAVDNAYNLDMGLRIIPGVPQPVAVRSTGLNAMAEKYVPALMLPAVTALQSPASLVLPSGWYKPRRMVEVFSERARPMLLTGVLDRGSDFERVAYEPG